MKAKLLIGLIFLFVLFSGCVQEEKPSINPKYYSDEKYCEKDSDCILRDNCCNPCYKDYVNIYNKAKIPNDLCAKICTMDCPPPQVFKEPVCKNNKCVPSS